VGIERYVCVGGESDKFLSIDKRVEKERKVDEAFIRTFLYLGAAACLEKSMDNSLGFHSTFGNLFYRV
jgi:hypothetical protein